MIKKNLSHAVETSNTKWKPTKITGVEFIPLNADPDERMGTILYRMAPKSTYPRHRHSEGEEMVILKGELSVGDRLMKGGDFLYSPPGSIHALSTTTGCIFVSMVTKPIEIIPDFKGDVDDTNIAVEATATGKAADSLAPAFREIDISNEPEPSPETQEDKSKSSE